MEDHGICRIEQRKAHREQPEDTSKIPNCMLYTKVRCEHKFEAKTKWIQFRFQLSTCAAINTSYLCTIADATSFPEHSAQSMPSSLAPSPLSTLRRACHRRPCPSLQSGEGGAWGRADFQRLKVLEINRSGARFVDSSFTSSFDVNIFFRRSDLSRNILM
ncbi:Os04g0564400 [Oryza sativa Japonica Group]|uniref:Os04g0564400 protein n=1 Tax=Oryza sativa subsp. japonica TaxID=39947 RepID=C7J0U5_ORYSJ|nr:Os04g0564400 [Oryza sativa Japonica Group]|eukprot:NP_001174046.1 Os04g0564400 [Oryza sativa Japonica Group]